MWNKIMYCLWFNLGRKRWNKVKELCKKNGVVAYIEFLILLECRALSRINFRTKCFDGIT